MGSLAADPERVKSVLRGVSRQLERADIEDATLEAELLLRQAFRRDGGELPSKAWLYQRLSEPTEEPVRAKLASLTARRLAHEPSAYITGSREFWGLDFEVTPGVLIPRPETELLVGEAVTLVQVGRAHRLRLVDVGTGCGAIATALATELPRATITAIDVSWDALAVARRNARRHGVEPRIQFRHGDLLLPLDHVVDVIVANLPYVPTSQWRELAPEVRDQEPRLALLGGDDGLDLIRSLLAQAPRYLRPGGAVCLEFGIGQAEEIAASVRRLMPGAQAKILEDFAGIPRLAVVQT